MNKNKKNLLNKFICKKTIVTRSFRVSVLPRDVSLFVCSPMFNYTWSHEYLRLPGRWSHAAMLWTTNP
jgi:hypothetical protein